MKAITIKNPWAYLVALGIKPIENRTWKTNYRGRVFIHVSAHRLSTQLINDEQYQDLIFSKKLPKSEKSSADFISEQPLSAIIGEVDIVDCVVNHPSVWAEKDSEINRNDIEARTIWNWVLENPVLYEKPILGVKGKLSFWEFNPEPTS